MPLRWVVCPWSALLTFEIVHWSVISETYSRAVKLRPFRFIRLSSGGLMAELDLGEVECWTLRWLFSSKTAPFLHLLLITILLWASAPWLRISSWASISTRTIEIRSSYPCSWTSSCFSQLLSCFLRKTRAYFHSDLHPLFFLFC